MQFSTIALLLSTSLTALCAPTPATSLSKRFNEKGPWQISHFTQFLPARHSYSSPSLNFDFYDPTTAIKTHCSFNQVVAEAYTPCQNKTVGFTYNGTVLNVQFSFIDPAVGQPDVVTEFGMNTTTLRCHHGYNGKTCTFKKGVAYLPIMPDAAIA